MWNTSNGVFGGAQQSPSSHGLVSQLQRMIAETVRPPSFVPNTSRPSLAASASYRYMPYARPSPYGTSHVDSRKVHMHAARPPVYSTNTTSINTRGAADASTLSYSRAAVMMRARNASDTEYRLQLRQSRTDWSQLAGRSIYTSFESSPVSVAAVHQQQASPATRPPRVATPQNTTISDRGNEKFMKLLEALITPKPTQQQSTRSTVGQDLNTLEQLHHERENTQRLQKHVQEKATNDEMHRLLAMLQERSSQKSHVPQQQTTVEILESLLGRQRQPCLSLHLMARLFSVLATTPPPSSTHMPLTYTTTTHSTAVSADAVWAGVRNILYENPFVKEPLLPSPLPAATATMSSTVHYPTQHATSMLSIPLRISYKQGARACQLHLITNIMDTTEMENSSYNFVLKIVQSRTMPGAASEDGRDTSGATEKAYKLAAHKTQVQLCTTPGRWYEVTAQLVDSKREVVLADTFIRFKAVFNADEMRQLYTNAATYAGDRLHPFQELYRCKPRYYFDHIRHTRNCVMEAYMKDENGQAASPINGVLKGLFWSAAVNTDGTMPLKSPFGNERLRVHPIHLLDPRRHQLWFADFYCNTFNHYVTVVVTERNSMYNSFCESVLVPLDFATNPFIRCNTMSDGTYVYSVNIGADAIDRRSPAVTPHLWVEVSTELYCRILDTQLYYTGDVHLQIGHTELINTSGMRGTSIIGGLHHNRFCQMCNLYPTRAPDEDDGREGSERRRRSLTRRNSPVPPHTNPFTDTPPLDVRADESLTIDDWDNYERITRKQRHYFLENMDDANRLRKRQGRPALIVKRLQKPARPPERKLDKSAVTRNRHSSGGEQRRLRSPSKGARSPPRRQRAYSGGAAVVDTITLSDDDDYAVAFDDDRRPAQSGVTLSTVATRILAAGVSQQPMYSKHL